MKDIEPGSAEEVAAVLRRAGTAGLSLAPRGGGTKMGWGNPPRKLHGILSTRRLDAVLDHAWADMTATVQAGCSVAAFQATLAQHGQRLALDPLWPDQATIGGVLATNDSGSLRLRFGALRDLILGVTVALPDGTLARSGGKVVKNVAGYDLPKLLTGSLGTLGVIVEATFRLYPLPAATLTWTVEASEIGPLHDLLLRILKSTLAPVAVQFRIASNTRTVFLDVRLESTPAAMQAQVKSLRRLISLNPILCSGEVEDRVWQAREELWEVPELAAIAKVSVRPSDWARLADWLGQFAQSQLNWRLVAQAFGIGMLRLEGSAGVVSTTLSTLRADVESWGGSLVILRHSPGVTEPLDAWGSPGDALPLMQRVKKEFDPQGVLNPGRFVGGI